jgi:ribonuclease E
MREGTHQEREDGSESDVSAAATAEGSDKSSLVSADDQAEEPESRAIPQRSDWGQAEENAAVGASESRSGPDSSEERRPAEAPDPEPQEEDKRPKRTGWWNRRSSFF